MPAPRRYPESLLDFQRMFPDDRACLGYLEQLRWPEGFVCPSCGNVGEPYRFKNRPTVLRCRACQKDTHITAGTVMHKTKLQPLAWFWGAYLVTSQTPGMSATQFARQLGFTCYETAFQVLHKLRAAMVRPDRDKIGSEWPVQIDETLIPCRVRKAQRREGKSQGKSKRILVPVVGAVEVRTKQEPVGTGQEPKTYAGRLRLLHVTTGSHQLLQDFVTDNVEPGSVVTTDGNPAYENLTKLGYHHRAVVLRGDSDLADEWLPMIHLIFSNLKAWLLGTHHSVSPQHMQAYLNEFVFRFNRRFYPMSAFNSVLGIAMHSEGPTYDALYQGRWLHPNPIAV